MPFAKSAPGYLIVDDDQVSVMAMQRRIRKGDPEAAIDVAYDGERALEIIRAAVAEIGHLPQLIVTLDLNMLRMNGIEFLSAARADPDLARLVIFVFTTSDAVSDVQAAKQFNPAGYIIKESGTQYFANGLQMLINCAKSSLFPV